MKLRKISRFTFARYGLFLVGIWFAFLSLVNLWGCFRDIGKGPFETWPSMDFMTALILITLNLGNWINAITKGICGAMCLVAVFRHKGTKFCVWAGIIGAFGFIVQSIVTYLLISRSLPNPYMLQLVYPLLVIVCGIALKPDKKADA